MAVGRATLRQCVLWVAFGLEPIGPRFEVLEGYPGHLDDDSLERLPEHDQTAIRQAQERITRGLMMGDLVASGRAAEIMPNGGFAALAGQEETEIPKEFWHPWDIDWNTEHQWRRTKPRPDVYSYVEVTVRVGDLKQVPRLPKASAAEPSRAGRPPKCDELDILRLCVCEFGADKLPTEQADFMRRMSEVVALVRDEAAVPAETRFKEIVREIYKVNREYKSARQALQRD